MDDGWRSVADSGCVSRLKKIVCARSCSGKVAARLFVAALNSEEHFFCFDSLV